MVGAVEVEDTRADGKTLLDFVGDDRGVLETGVEVVVQVLVVDSVMIAVHTMIEGALLAKSEPTYYYSYTPESRADVCLVGWGLGCYPWLSMNKSRQFMAFTLTEDMTEWMVPGRSSDADCPNMESMESYG